MTDINRDTLSDSEFAKILAAMQRACATREYCVADILKKLQRYKLDGIDSAKIITSLKEDCFIDELRYAEAFVNDKSRLCGWGRTKILWVLKSKQIDKEIIEKAISILSVDDARDQLRKILAAKLKMLPLLSESTNLVTDAYTETAKVSSLERWKQREKQKAKLIRFGLSRGFEYDMVLAVADEILRY